MRQRIKPSTSTNLLFINQQNVAPASRLLKETIPLVTYVLNVPYATWSSTNYLVFSPVIVSPFFVHKHTTVGKSDTVYTATLKKNKSVSGFSLLRRPFVFCLHPSQFDAKWRSS